ncbi:MAG: hypothetical protein K2H60_03490 [Muribaculaceae bacterium]|nr:hypothetical protein [Muribaculaceae bacterium]
MKYFFILTFIFFTLFPANAIKKINANPVNVAFILAQEKDTVKMATLCDYYGYRSQQSNDGYITYVHPSGSIIRYTFKDVTEEQPYPRVEVKSKLSSKDVDFTLTDLNFRKLGSGYERKLGQYARSVFHCQNGSGGFLIFHQRYVPRKEKEL